MALALRQHVSEKNTFSINKFLVNEVPIFLMLTD